MTHAIQVRSAQLDDTRTISKLYCDRVSVWQRLDANGQVENVAYDDLTIYERWLHGGAWMSLETATLFLSHILLGGGVALVATRGDTLLGYAEAYPGTEPQPFGQHFHIAQMIISQEASSEAQAIKDALVEHIISMAKQYGFNRLTVAFSSYDQDAFAYYRRHAMQRIERIVRYTLTAQPGQTFYKATSHPDSSPAHIEGLQMTIGRQENARYHWEAVWPRTFDALTEIKKRRTHRLHINAAGHEALVCIQQQLYDLRSADVHCWSSKQLDAQLLTAIRDWAHRQDYRTLVMPVPEATVKQLGPEAENTPYQQDIYAVDL